MFKNYQYFLVLAEELNLSNASKRLFVSHQCLSKYLKKLEEQCEIVLFDRKPQFALTYAGQLLYEALRKAENIESNIQIKFKELNHGQSGELRIGTTEGRLRILLPNILYEFKKQYPNVNLRMISNKTAELLDMISNNKLDMAIVAPSIPKPNFNYDVVIKEHMYLVISDNMLSEYFPEDYPNCKVKLSHGADLRLFKEVPFVLNLPGFSSRLKIDKHLLKIGATLNCVNESTAMDLHHLMSARDYAASFCLTMYIPDIWKLNDSSSTNSTLNIFPIADFNEINPISITYLKDKVFPEYGYAAMKIIKNLCQYYSKIDINANTDC